MKKTRKNAAGLSDREDVFVHEYIKDFNRTQAAIRAGYTTQTARHNSDEIMARPAVRKAVDRLLNERKERLKVDSDRIVQEIASVAWSDINSFLAVEPYEVHDFERRIVDGKVQKVEVTRIEERIRLRSAWHTIDSRPIQSIKDGKDGLSFKMHDKMKALELLARIFKLVGDEKDKGSTLEQLARAFISGARERSDGPPKEV